MAKAQSKVNVILVGDVRPETQPAENIFALNLDLLRNADAAFGQLETPFSERGSPHVGRGLTTKAPSKNVDSLSYAGFDVISFASNHALDWGYDAFHDTIDGLKRNKIEVVGVGENLAEARLPVILDRKGTESASWLTIP